MPISYGRRLNRGVCDCLAGRDDGWSLRERRELLQELRKAVDSLEIGSGACSKACLGPPRRAKRAVRSSRCIGRTEISARDGRLGMWRLTYGAQVTSPQLLRFLEAFQAFIGDTIEVIEQCKHIVTLRICE